MTITLNKMHGPSESENGQTLKLRHVLVDLPSLSAHFYKSCDFYGCDPLTKIQTKPQKPTDRGAQTNINMAAAQ